MKKTKKRLLSCLAATIVLISGLIVWRMVDYQADAVQSVTDTIVVKVFDKYPKATITFPEHEAQLIGEKQTVSYDWSNATDLKFVLKYGDAEIDSWEDTCLNYEPEPLSGNACSEPDPAIPYGGTRTHDIELKEYGKYTLTVTATGPIGSDPVESHDSIVFYRLATNITYIGSEFNGDPNVRIEYEDGVKKLRVQVYKNGKPILPDFIVYNAKDGTNSIEETIGMPDNAKKGKYTIEVEGLDEAGKPISDPSSTEFEYDPPTPNTPETGSVLTQLNIARADFLITGFLIFFAATIAAIFLLYRQKEQ